MLAIVIAMLMAGLTGLCSIVAGVWVMAGLGWGLVAAGIALVIVAAVLLIAARNV